MTNKHNNYINLIIAIFVVLIPFFWLLGIKFVFFQLLAGILFIFSIKNINLRNKLLNYSVVFILIYLISNGIAIISNPMNFEITDFVGAIYSCTYWVSGILLLLSIVNSKDKNIDIIFKGIAILSIIQILIFVLSAVKWNLESGDTSSMAIIYNYLPNTLQNNNFLKDVMSINIATTDYVSTGMIYRFNGFYSYPVAAALGSVYLLVYTYLYEVDYEGKIKSIFIKIFKLIIISMLFLCVYYCRSRIVFILIPISIFTTLIAYYINKNNKKYIVGIIIAAILIIVLIILNTDIVEKILSLRAGSSSDRLISYKYALQTFKGNPIFGVGDKFKAEGIFILIGSHSTLIGALVRSGIVGLIGVIGFLVTISIKIFKNKKYIHSVFSKKLWLSTTFLFFATTIWMITEEIDWPQIVAFLFFLNVSIIFKFEKIVSNNRKEEIN